MGHKPVPRTQGETLEAFLVLCCPQVFWCPQVLKLLGVLPSPPVASRALLGLLPDEFVQIWVQPTLVTLLGLGPGVIEDDSRDEGLTGSQGGGLAGTRGGP